MPAPETSLILAYVARHNRLRLAAGVAVGRAWDRLAGLDDAAADRFAEVAAQIGVAAQAETAANVDGYLAALLGALTDAGSPLGINPEAVSGPAVRAGADPTEVYRRAIVTARVAVSRGRSGSEAMNAGRRRAVGTAETDVALTQRAATVQVAETEDRIVGYRRVLTGGSCALCATASTQRYGTADLMPIHNHCDCGVAPIVGSRDPGQVINRPLLRDLKNADPDFARSRKLRVDEDGTVHLPEVTVRQHGELGPTLTIKGQEFTGPSDVAA